MAEEYCKAKKAMCDPKDCNREFCWWRDSVWAIKNMEKWAYSTETTKPSPKPDTVKEDNKDDNNSD